MHEYQRIVEETFVGNVDHPRFGIHPQRQLAAGRIQQVLHRRGATVQPPGWRSVASATRSRSNLIAAGRGGGTAAGIAVGQFAVGGVGHHVQPNRQRSAGIRAATDSWNLWPRPARANSQRQESDGRGSSGGSGGA